MNCPRCGSKTAVEDTRGYFQKVWRRRICPKCKLVLHTEEEIKATNTQEISQPIEKHA